MTVINPELDFSTAPSETRKACRKGRHPKRIARQRTSESEPGAQPLSQLEGKPKTEGVEDAFSLSFAEPPQNEEPSYSEWFQEHVKKSRTMTYFVTFWIHWMAVLCMAAVFLSDPEEFRPVMLDAIFSDVESESETPLEFVDVELTIPEEEAPASEEAISTEALAEQSSTLDEIPMMNLPDAVQAMALSSQETQDSSGPNEQAEQKPNKNPMNVPRHAVAAGSFAVWTEPENPDPGEPYRIVIQIRLPDGTERYSVADLEGVVVGSDGYQKLIPGPLRGFLPIQDGIVKLQVHIVSADKNVQDTVFIRSKLLREAQRLRIQF